MPASLDLINEGSKEEFIDALVEEALQHRAVHHPYLQRLAAGRLPNITEALRDYAHQYSFYSNWFTKYLDGVITNLESEKHKTQLLENLEEENGIPGSDRFEDQAHVKIFADFKRRIGVDKEYEANNPATTTVRIWRDLFLQKCKSPISGVGLGGIGLATEFVVPHFYPYIISAIHKHTELGEEGSLFFRLHVDCDGDHGDTIVEIATEIAETAPVREALRFGVRSALNLREAFWDSQLARALVMKS